MTRPLLILDQHFRRVEELFRPEAFDALFRLCRIEGALNWPMNPNRIDALIGEAAFLVAARPRLTGVQIAGAGALRAVIEVSGAFHEGTDYEACLARGIEVLSSMPGFRESVAEMALTMILAGARGLVDEHEAFRRNGESWLADREGRDFTLHGQTVGFVGYGEIARETHRLMRGFDPTVLAYDPWLDPAATEVELVDLDSLMARCRVVVVAAAPTRENRHLVGAAQIARLRPGALVVLISRAHCVDFDALIEATRSGRITAAIDVFPEEPVPFGADLRQAPNVILSPHRAAAVPGGRHLIGDMIVHDVAAILEGRPERRLKPADPEHLRSLIGAQPPLSVVR